MAELNKTKLPRKLVILALLVGCLFLVSPEPALADVGIDCGQPYLAIATICPWWDVLGLFCESRLYGCADCNTGTYCYEIYN